MLPPPLKLLMGGHGPPPLPTPMNMYSLIKEDTLRYYLSSRYQVLTVVTHPKIKLLSFLV